MVGRGPISSYPIMGNALGTSAPPQAFVVVDASGPEFVATDGSAPQFIVQEPS